MRLRIASVTALVIAVTIAFAASASAGTWTGTHTLQGIFAVSSPPEVPVVAMNASGHFVAAWDSTGNIRFAERTAAGWTPSQWIVHGATGGPVAVAIGTDGTTAVAWDTVGDRYHPSKLVVTVRPPSGAFSAPAELAPGAWYFKLGIAADGSVTAIWNGGGIEAATLPAGGTWSSAQVLSATGTLPDLAINDAGAALAVWQDGSPSQIGASYRAAGGAWSPPEVVSTGTGLQTWNPKPGIDAAGNAAVGYVDGNTMMVALRPAAGPWAAPAAVSGPQQMVYYPALAIDNAGDVLAGWQRLDSGNNGRIYASWLPAGGAWTRPTPLSGPAQQADWPTAFMSADGSVGGLAWLNDGNMAAKVSMGPVGGPWVTKRLGDGYWGTTVPAAAGGGSVGAAWAQLGYPGNPNSAKLVARVFA